MLERLARIEALDREGAGPAALLAEMRALVSEAEAWSRVERCGEEAVAAIRSCRDALDEGRLAVR